jgi:large subunit ribosomal protein L10
MKRAEKAATVETLQGDVARARMAVLAEYRGLTVVELNRLRRAVREADGRCRVTKNTLTKRAFAGSRYEGLGPMLQGPLAVIFGFRDPVTIAKLAVKLADELPKFELKGAMLDGEVLQTPAVKALATLPAREVLLAQLLGLLQAPATQLVRLLNEPGARLARLADAIGKRREAGAGEGAAS